MLYGGVAVCAAAIGTVVFAQGESKQEPRAAPQIQPKADSVLRNMCDYLAHLPAFTFQADSVDEIVLESGQKLQFPATSNVYLQRPNHLRSDRLSAPVDASLYYDGSKMTLFGRRSNVYATTSAPGTLDEAIDFGRKKLKLDAPAGDLLYASPYEILTEDVVAGKYLGTEQVGGVQVHHLAFEGNETNWEIWIDAGPRPLPRRFVITSKKVASLPQFSVEVSNWNVAPLLTADMFAFKPPKGAQEIKFDEAWKAAAAAKKAHRGGQETSSLE